ncbi:MOSC domain-containing protein [Streptomonospora sp. PA3]|uniref:MOSC domain-containing protein n=1 Tax=Streptomonospora sp. PA3 TaxID=2607326 RepID=UPI0012DFACA9|nr:MOSC domain-containing protein [Streptomonospora sp. PA3]MUL43430.1 MOSC domain-containing protein [Streptomonospora sp. PA3]
MAARVAAVGFSPQHTFSKPAAESIRLLAGLGVDGDAHMGATVRHRSRVARDPTQPNRRQVHLIAGEFHDELCAAGFRVRPGDLGENVTTRGLDLLVLPSGTLLELGASAVVELTGLRNPCPQIDDFQQGLLAETIGRDADGNAVLKAGVMGVVRAAGEVRPGDAIAVRIPEEPHRPLRRV